MVVECISSRSNALTMNQARLAKRNTVVTNGAQSTSSVRGRNGYEGFATPGSSEGGDLVEVSRVSIDSCLTPGFANIVVHFCHCCAFELVKELLGLEMKTSGLSASPNLISY